MGLYIIKSGYCKVGLSLNKPHDASGNELAWYRPKEKNLRFTTDLTDPKPSSHVGRDQMYKIHKRLDLVIDDTEKKSKNFTHRYQRL